MDSLTIVDENGTPVEIAEVIAINSEEEERSTNVSGGSYSISVSAGIWTVYAYKVGYESVNSFQYSIEGADNKEADSLILKQNIKNITDDGGNLPSSAKNNLDYIEFKLKQLSK